MSAQTRGAAMEEQMSFSFDGGSDVQVNRFAVPAEHAHGHVAIHVAQVTCLSSRRITAEKRDENDAYSRVMEYARSLRKI